MKKPGLILVFAILVSFISIRMDSPPDVIGADAPDSVFSAKRAYPYLNEICQAPHSTGTVENKRVREYILAQCKSFGLDAYVQHTAAIRNNKWGMTGANVYNIIARLKGKNPSKALLVMSHYDSQPNTPGAGDDGAGVAAMLETARMLTGSEKVYNNDVIFLFTDGEEAGLLGAQGFVQDSVLSKEVGLVLNFEGRGNAGVSSMFEVNARNGWAIKEFMKAAAYPSGNSLGYEIYKLLPNDTDYTVFRKAGISGLNHAFIEGYVNYHSPNDKAENLDLRSLQQHGSNMLSLIKHFGNISLLQTKADDISFFNLIGNTMISYPASWNLGFTILCVVLYICFVVMGVVTNQIKFKGFAIGFIAFVGVLITMCLSTVLLIKGIEWAYPLYKNFYSTNPYNCVYYFSAFAVVAVALYAWLYRWLLKKFSLASLMAGLFLLLTGILIMLYLIMPTAIFVIMIPLLYSLIGNIVVMARENLSELAKSLIQLAFVIPAIILLSPVIKLMMIVFGLSPTTAAAVIFLGLLLGLLLPVFQAALTESKAVQWVALSAFVLLVVMAHFKSDFTEQTPLQSNVQYQVRADENKAYWISSFTTTDEWNKQFFSKPEIESGRLINDAAMIPLAAPVVLIKWDSIENNVRKVSLHFQSMRDAISFHIEFDEKNQPNAVLIQAPDGGKGTGVENGDFKVVDFLGLDNGALDITVEVKANLPLQLTVTDRTMGLPLNTFHDYPVNVIPGVGYRANTTQVVKKFVL